MKIKLLKWKNQIKIILFILISSLSLLIVSSEYQNSDKLQIESKEYEEYDEYNEKTKIIGLFNDKEKKIDVNKNDDFTFFINNDPSNEEYQIFLLKDVAKPNVDSLSKYFKIEIKEVKKEIFNIPQNKKNQFELFKKIAQDSKSFIEQKTKTFFIQMTKDMPDEKNVTSFQFSTFDSSGKEKKHVARIIWKKNKNNKFDLILRNYYQNIQTKNKEVSIIKVNVLESDKNSFMIANIIQKDFNIKINENLKDIINELKEISWRKKSAFLNLIKSKLGIDLNVFKEKISMLKVILYDEGNIINFMFICHEKYKFKDNSIYIPFNKNMVIDVINNLNAKDFDDVYNLDDKKKLSSHVTNQEPKKVEIIKVIKEKIIDKKTKLLITNNMISFVPKDGSLIIKIDKTKFGDKISKDIEIFNFQTLAQKQKQQANKDITKIQKLFESLDNSKTNLPQAENILPSSLTQKTSAQEIGFIDPSKNNLEKVVVSFKVLQTNDEMGTLKVEATLSKIPGDSKKITFTLIGYLTKLIKIHLELLNFFDKLDNSPTKLPQAKDILPSSLKQKKIPKEIGFIFPLKKYNLEKADFSLRVLHTNDAKGTLQAQIIFHIMNSEKQIVNSLFTFTLTGYETTSEAANKDITKIKKLFESLDNSQTKLPQAKNILPSSLKQKTVPKEIGFIDPSKNNQEKVVVSFKVLQTNDERGTLQVEVTLSKIPGDSKKITFTLRGYETASEAANKDITKIQKLFESLDNSQTKLPQAKNILPSSLKQKTVPKEIGFIDPSKNNQEKVVVSFKVLQTNDEMGNLQVEATFSKIPGDSKQITFTLRGYETTSEAANKDITKIKKLFESLDNSQIKLSQAQKILPSSLTQKTSAQEIGFIDPSKNNLEKVVVSFKVLQTNDEMGTLKVEATLSKIPGDSKKITFTLIGYLTKLIKIHLELLNFFDKLDNSPTKLPQAKDILPSSLKQKKIPKEIGFIFPLKKYNLEKADFSLRVLHTNDAKGTLQAQILFHIMNSEKQIVNFLFTFTLTGYETTSEAANKDITKIKKLFESLDNSQTNLPQSENIFPSSLKQKTIPKEIGFIDPSKSNPEKVVVSFKVLQTNDEMGNLQVEATFSKIPGDSKQITFTLRGYETTSEAANKDITKIKKLFESLDNSQTNLPQSENIFPSSLKQKTIPKEIGFIDPSKNNQEKVVVSFKVLHTNDEMGTLQVEVTLSKIPGDSKQITFTLTGYETTSEAANKDITKIKKLFESLDNSQTNLPQSENIFPSSLKQKTIPKEIGFIDPSKSNPEKVVVSFKVLQTNDEMGNLQVEATFSKIPGDSKKITFTLTGYKSKIKEANKDITKIQKLFESLDNSQTKLPQAKNIFPSSLKQKTIPKEIGFIDPSKSNPEKVVVSFKVLQTNDEMGNLQVEATFSKIPGDSKKITFTLTGYKSKIKEANKDITKIQKLFESLDNSQTKLPQAKNILPSSLKQKTVPKEIGFIDPSKNNQEKVVVSFKVLQTNDERGTLQVEVTLSKIPGDSKKITFTLRGYETTSEAANKDITKIKKLFESLDNSQTKLPQAKNILPSSLKQKTVPKEIGFIDPSKNNQEKVVVSFKVLQTNDEMGTLQVEVTLSKIPGYSKKITFTLRGYETASEAANKDITKIQKLFESLDNSQTNLPQPENILPSSLTQKTSAQEIGFIDPSKNNLEKVVVSFKVLQTNDEMGTLKVEVTLSKIPGDSKKITFTLIGYLTKLIKIHLELLNFFDKLDNSPTKLPQAKDILPSSLKQKKIPKEIGFIFPLKKYNLEKADFSLRVLHTNDAKGTLQAQIIFHIMNSEKQIVNSLFTFTLTGYETTSEAANKDITKIKKLFESLDNSQTKLPQAKNILPSSLKQKTVPKEIGFIDPSKNNQEKVVVSFKVLQTNDERGTLQVEVTLSKIPGDSKKITFTLRGYETASEAANKDITKIQKLFESLDNSQTKLPQAENILPSSLTQEISSQEIGFIDPSKNNLEKVVVSFKVLHTNDEMGTLQVEVTLSKIPGDSKQITFTLTGYETTSEAANKDITKIKKLFESLDNSQTNLPQAKDILPSSLKQKTIPKEIGFIDPSKSNPEKVVVSFKVLQTNDEMGNLQVEATFSKIPGDSKKITFTLTGYETTSEAANKDITKIQKLFESLDNSQTKLPQAKNILPSSLKQKTVPKEIGFIDPSKNNQEKVVVSFKVLQTNDERGTLQVEVTLSKIPGDSKQITFTLRGYETTSEAANKDITKIKKLFESLDNSQTNLPQSENILPSSLTQEISSQEIGFIDPSKGNQEKVVVSFKVLQTNDEMGTLQVKATLSKIPSDSKQITFTLTGYKSKIKEANKDITKIKKLFESLDNSQTNLPQSENIFPSSLKQKTIPKEIGFIDPSKSNPEKVVVSFKVLQTNDEMGNLQVEATFSKIPGDSKKITFTLTGYKSKIKEANKDITKIQKLFESLDNSKTNLPQAENILPSSLTQEISSQEIGFIDPSKGNLEKVVVSFKVLHTNDEMGTLQVEVTLSKIPGDSKQITFTLTGYETTSEAANKDITKIQKLFESLDNSQTNLPQSENIFPSSLKQKTVPKEIGFIDPSKNNQEKVVVSFKVLQTNDERGTLQVEVTLSKIPGDSKQITFTLRGYETTSEAANKDITKIQKLFESLDNIQTNLPQSENILPSSLTQEISSQEIGFIDPSKGNQEKVVVSFKVLQTNDEMGTLQVKATLSKIPSDSKQITFTLTGYKSKIKEANKDITKIKKLFESLDNSQTNLPQSENILPSSLKQKTIPKEIGFIDPSKSNPEKVVVSFKVLHTNDEMGTLQVEVTLSKIPGDSKQITFTLTGYETTSEAANKDITKIKKLFESLDNSQTNLPQAENILPSSLTQEISSQEIGFIDPSKSNPEKVVVSFKVLQTNDEMGNLQVEATFSKIPGDSKKITFTLTGYKSKIKEANKDITKIQKLFESLDNSKTNLLQAENILPSSLTQEISSQEIGFIDPSKGNLEKVVVSFKVLQTNDEMGTLQVEVTLSKIPGDSKQITFTLRGYETKLQKQKSILSKIIFDLKENDFSNIYNKSIKNKLPSDFSNIDDSKKEFIINEIQKKIEKSYNFKLPKIFYEDLISFEYNDANGSLKIKFNTEKLGAKNKKNINIFNFKKLIDQEIDILIQEIERIVGPSNTYIQVNDIKKDKIFIKNKDFINNAKKFKDYTKKDLIGVLHINRAAFSSKIINDNIEVTIEFPNSTSKKRLKYIITGFKNKTKKNSFSSSSSRLSKNLILGISICSILIVIIIVIIVRFYKIKKNK